MLITQFTSSELVKSYRSNTIRSRKCHFISTRDICNLNAAAIFCVQCTWEMYLFLADSSLISDVSDAYLDNLTSPKIRAQEQSKYLKSKIDKFYNEEIIGGEEKRYVIRPLHLHLGVFAPGHVHKIAT